MNAKKLVKEIMAARGWSQAKLAEEAGFPGQSNITGILNRGSADMRVDQLVRLATAMGCEVIIRDKYNTKNEWVVTHDAD